VEYFMHIVTHKLLNHCARLGTFYSVPWFGYAVWWLNQYRLLHFVCILYRLLTCSATKHALWARLVQLHERLHEQLHNFNSQIASSLPSSLVSFSENSLSQS
jgi:hypothetical protein